MTKKEWMEYLEKTWDAAQKEAWSEPQFECPRCGHCCHVEEEHMSREAMKHTPGPWNYDRSGYSLYVNSGRELVTALSMDGKRLETSEANARLIAAAPDLLSALDDLARYADTCELFLRETHPGKADMLRKRVTAAIDAIAKATGDKA